VTFRGWPPEALAFYEGLEADNSKRYWTEQRAVYDQCVLAPMRALLDELAAYGPFRIFRPNRDVRFSKDKSPYKTTIAAAGESDGGAMYYVQLSSRGLMSGAGFYHLAPDQLERFRAAVLDERTGRELARIADGAQEAGFTLAAHETLKSAPRGVPKDHPRIELLRRKGLVVMREHAPAKWLHTKQAEDRVLATWKAAAPVNRWLERNVGPSRLPPPEPR
jgi:uncharacterized protein (TIGR02453 family)